MSVCTTAQWAVLHSRSAIGDSYSDLQNILVEKFGPNKSNHFVSLQSFKTN